MATIVLTNQIASQALRGQNVKITLSGSDAITYLPQLAVGMVCYDDNSGDHFGYIYSIDSYGNSFEICPVQPDKAFISGGSYGYFLSEEAVDVVLS